MCHNSTQNIPGEVRFDALCEIYKDNKNVKIYSVDDGYLPQHDTDVESKDVFYSLWVPFVRAHISDLDAVFTSEVYGDDFANYLAIKHVSVDQERFKHKISGTKMRENPLKSWEFIPHILKPFFVKKIALMGPESVGKSTMSMKLAEHFETNYVEEYGRTIFEENGNNVSVNDFTKIMKGRQELEDKLIKNSNKLLICDTEDITTYLFSKMYYPNDYIRIEDELLSIMGDKKSYDLYILLKPDCEWVQDGTREFGGEEERQIHYNVIKNELIDRGYNFIEVGGNWESRFNKCVENIKSNFNI
jgi:HTH-type transcriptional repressor of NAD biosynthesis genes